MCCLRNLPSSPGDIAYTQRQHLRFRYQVRFMITENWLKVDRKSLLVRHAYTRVTATRWQRTGTSGRELTTASVVLWDYSTRSELRFHASLRRRWWSILKLHVARRSGRRVNRGIVERHVEIARVAVVAADGAAVRPSTSATVTVDLLPPLTGFGRATTHTSTADTTRPTGCDSSTDCNRPTDRQILVDVTTRHENGHWR